MRNNKCTFKRLFWASKTMLLASKNNNSPAYGHILLEFGSSCEDKCTHFFKMQFLKFSVSFNITWYTRSNYLYKQLFSYLPELVISVVNEIIERGLRSKNVVLWVMFFLAAPQLIFYTFFKSQSKKAKFEKGLKPKSHLFLKCMP